MHKKKLSEQDKINICEWGLEGVRLKDIVDRLGGKVSKQRIQQVLKRNSIKNTEIWRNNREQERLKQLEIKYGKQFFDIDRRRDVIYQIVKDKFVHKKSNAKQSGIEWAIEFGEIEFPTVCPVLGIELDYWTSSRQDNSISFDRIDNSKGYVSGNVIIMSWRANRIKNDGTVEEHKKIYEFMKKHLQSS